MAVSPSATGVTLTRTVKSRAEARPRRRPRVHVATDPGLDLRCATGEELQDLALVLPALVGLRVHHDRGRPCCVMNTGSCESAARLMTPAVSWRGSEMGMMVDDRAPQAIGWNRWSGACPAAA
jgi:hypothetical protein